MSKYQLYPVRSLTCKSTRSPATRARHAKRFTRSVMRQDGWPEAFNTKQVWLAVARGEPYQS